MGAVGYLSELRRGDEVVATGRFAWERPLEVGERVAIGGTAVSLCGERCYGLSWVVNWAFYAGRPTSTTWLGEPCLRAYARAGPQIGRKNMHARVTTLSGSPDNADAGIANFRDNVVPYAKSDGKGAILLIDRESGKAIAVTLWEDEEAMRASEESADALRADAARQMGAQQPTVERYEVAVFEV